MELPVCTHYQSLLKVTDCSHERCWRRFSVDSDLRAGRDALAHEHGAEHRPPAPGRDVLSVRSPPWPLGAAPPRVHRLGGVLLLGRDGRRHLLLAVSAEMFPILPDFLSYGPTNTGSP